VNIPEPVRAWARPVLAFLALAAVIGAVLLAGVIAVLNLGTIAGIGTTMILAATALGSGVWLIDHKGWV